MFQGVIVELRDMVARVQQMGVDLIEVGLEFEGEALEEMAEDLGRQVAELADANLALRNVVPSDVASDVKDVLERHGLVVPTTHDEGDAK